MIRQVRQKPTSPKGIPRESGDDPSHVIDQGFAT